MNLIRIAGTDVAGHSDTHIKMVIGSKGNVAKSMMGVT